MMRFQAVWFVAILFASPAAAEPPKPWITGLKNPRAVAVGPDRRVYVTVAEDPSKYGTGSVMVIENGKAVPFATGLGVPLYLTAWQNWLFVSDTERVSRIDQRGKVEGYGSYIPSHGEIEGYRGICVDERGLCYVSVLLAEKIQGRVDPEYRRFPTSLSRIDKGGRGEASVGLAGSIRRALDGRTTAGLGLSAIAMDGMTHVVGLDVDGAVVRVKLPGGSGDLLAPGPIGMARSDVALTSLESSYGGVVWDHNGRIYRALGSQVDVIARPGEQPVRIASGLVLAGGPCLSPDGKSILVPDVKAGTITAIPTGDPKNPIDETPLPLATEVAFPDLQWAGWSGETPAGKPNALRPLILTHANDNSGRNFVATQHGVIHVFPNDQAAKTTKVFLDIQSKVRYDDKTNEEGFLGLAFHPDYKRTGEFFVFYTEKTPGHHNVLSRYRLSKDDPDRADPASEEVLLRVEHKYWNHDGGTVIFGPDGFLYLALGDGGLGNDPDGNGQNLNTILGKIIRIDVNRRDGDKPYGIPKDNPFVGRTDARPEIYAYGLRNVWRMAFDRQTGRLWAADVGQNLYEEIDLIEKGGNYGWGTREGLHPFGPKGVGPKPELIDPIWEYDHEVGKSITGGTVYRGSRLPELSGHYVYADYVSGKIWALRYDEMAKRAVANRPIADRKLPIMSFGEDDRGELYLMTYAQSGQGIYRFVRSTSDGTGSAK